MPLIKILSHSTGQMYPELLNLFNNGDPFNNFGRDKRATREFTITIEVAVFFDEAAYKIFAPYFNYDDKKIRDMILAYMNGVSIRVLRWVVH